MIAWPSANQILSVISLPSLSLFLSAYNSGPALLLMTPAPTALVVKEAALLTPNPLQQVLLLKKLWLVFILLSILLAKLSSC